MGPRQRLLKVGIVNLSNEELLALLLGTGTQKRGVLELSRYIINRYPLDKLSALSISDLSALDGISQAKASAILAALEIGKRAVQKEKDGLPTIRKPEDVLLCLNGYKSYRKEHFWVIYLNARQQLLKSECVFIGTLDASLIHPREIYEPALRYLAASIIIVHNHPSGDSQPSKADLEVTQSIAKAGSIMGISLQDHLIITRDGYTSMAEKGLIGYV